MLVIVNHIDTTNDFASNVSKDRNVRDFQPYNNGKLPIGSVKR